jgi:hypothetical protein
MMANHRSAERKTAGPSAKEAGDAELAQSTTQSTKQSSRAGRRRRARQKPSPHLQYAKKNSQQRRAADEPQLFAVYDGRRQLGDVLVARDGVPIAILVDGRQLGAFGSITEARRAVIREARDDLRDLAS